MLFATWDGFASQQDLVNKIREREEYLDLEMNSCSLTRFLVDILLEEYPDAKFILTIRDCYSWLDSMLNHQNWSQSTKPVHPTWKRMNDLRLHWNKEGEDEYAPEEQILAQNNLYTLNGYLSYWAQQNRKVLTTVPQDRLLVVRTHEISQEIDRIADFLGVPSETLDRTKAHSFKARQKSYFLSQIDRQFLNQKFNTHCKSLMDEFFPDFRGIPDALVSTTVNA